MLSIGIDLGTTYSCVGYYNNGKVDIIPNENGERITPSFVSFTDNERIIGSLAKNLIASNPLNTVYDVKRLIGRDYLDQNIQDNLKHFSYKITNSNNKPIINVNYKKEKKEFTPEEISSMILNKMKSIAEEYLGTEIKNAVITVPAYFNDTQRQATKDAAKIIGLNVLRIINEPTAAAIAYGLDKINTSSRNVLIYDLGGGTLDISLLTIENGIFEIKATSGNTYLGGVDFDNKIVDYIINEFYKKYNIDLTSSQKSMRKIKTAAEKAKKILSGTNKTIIELDTLYDGIDFNIVLTRAKFENLCIDIFNKALEPVITVLQDANISKNDIHDIVLIGGSTRIPKIQELLSEFFNGKELCKNINPDEAVAYGAAIQAAILSDKKDDILNEIVLLDITPLSLGIETNGNIMTVLIPRGTPIPIKKTQIFSTVADNQTIVSIKVFEGERQLTTYNNKLGEFYLKGIPPMPKGMPQIEITYYIDNNGILNISAFEKSSGKKENIIITNQNNRLNNDDINRMIKDAETFKENDNIIKKTIETKNKLENYCYLLKSSKQDNYFDEILEWLENDKLTFEEIDKKYNELYYKYH